MVRLLCIPLALPLTSCAASFSLLPPSPPREIVLPGGGPPQIVETPNAEIIEPRERAMCQSRARFFRGTVSIPCEDIARMVAP